MKRGTDTPGITWDGSKYIIRLSVQVDGHRVEVTRTIKEKISPSELRRRRAALKIELDEKVERLKRVDKDGETLSAFAKRWLVDRTAKGKARKHTTENRTTHLEEYILPIIGHIEVRKLRPADLDNWMKEAAERRLGSGKQKGQLYRLQTLLTSWAVLRAMVKRAVVMCNLDKDPSAGLRFDVGDGFADQQRPKKRVKATLTAAELGRVLAAASTESPDIRAMMVVGFASGMRFCELSALEWRDIDLDKGFLEIRRSQVGGNLGEPKTESTRRHVYLPPSVVEVLRVHHQWQIDEEVRGLSKGLVFPAATGGYRYPQILTKPFARCCKLAKVNKRLTAHCMRKTTNNLVRQAAGDTVARAMVGHVTEEMTRLYSDVDEDERAKAHTAAFGEAFGRSETQSVGAKCGTEPLPH